MSPRRYVAFRGRLGRAKFVGLYGMPYVLLAALPGVLLPHGPRQVLLETAVLVLFLPGISRRLHDLDRSLWLLAGLWGIYAMALVVQTTGVYGDHRRLVILLANLPFYLLILSLFILPGTQGTNRYGVLS